VQLRHPLGCAAACQWSQTAICNFEKVTSSQACSAPAYRAAAGAPGPSDESEVNSRLPLVVRPSFEGFVPPALESPPTCREPQSSQPTPYCQAFLKISSHQKSPCHASATRLILRQHTYVPNTHTSRKDSQMARISHHAGQMHLPQVWRMQVPKDPPSMCCYWGH